MAFYNGSARWYVGFHSGFHSNVTFSLLTRYMMGSCAHTGLLPAALLMLQAGPECPAKPLLQETGLRVCHGTAGQVGLRYSGM